MNKISDNRSSKGNSMFLDGVHSPENSFQDKGGASRFFKRIIYTPKAGKEERNLGCESMEEKAAFEYGSIKKSVGRTGINTPRKNNHPTVKPIKLMEYLCELTKTPPQHVCNDCGFVIGLNYGTKEQTNNSMQEVRNNLSKIQLEKTKNVLQQKVQFNLQHSIARQQRVGQ